MKTSAIEVHDMLSVFSVDEVEKRIGEVPGVQSVTVNFAAGNATVRYDETQVGRAPAWAPARHARCAGGRCWSCKTCRRGCTAWACPIESHSGRYNSAARGPARQHSRDAKAWRRACACGSTGNTSRRIAQTGCCCHACRYADAGCSGSGCAQAC